MSKTVKTAALAPVVCHSLFYNFLKEIKMLKPILTLSAVFMLCAATAQAQSDAAAYRNNPAYLYVEPLYFHFLDKPAGFVDAKVKVNQQIISNPTDAWPIEVTEYITNDGVKKIYGVKKHFIRYSDTHTPLPIKYVPNQTVEIEWVIDRNLADLPRGVTAFRETLNPEEKKLSFEKQLKMYQDLYKAHEAKHEYHRQTVTLPPYKTVGGLYIFFLPCNNEIRVVIDEKEIKALGSVTGLDPNDLDLYQKVQDNAQKKWANVCPKP